MITQDVIKRFREMQEETPKQLVVIDTQQFFEIEIPLDVDPEDFLDSEMCRKECADRIMNGTTELIIDRVGKVKDKDGNWDV